MSRPVKLTAYQKARYIEAREWWDWHRENPRVARWAWRYLREFDWGKLR